MLLYNSPTMAQLMAEEPNPIPALILVVVNAILEVFFLCFVGFILARRGIVDDKAKKTLNKVNVTLFTPALLFSKVAFTLTPDKLQELIIIPVGFVIISVFSAAVAYSLGSVFRLRKGQRNFAIACAMFQNSNSLPIALMQSLIGEKMPISWGPIDSKDEMLGRALTYLVLFSTLGIIVRWSIGVKLLTSAENDHDQERVDEEEDSEDSLDEREGTLYNNGENGEGSPLMAGGGPGGRPTRKQSLHRKSSTISFSNPPSTLGYTNRPARTYDNDTALSSPNNKNLALGKKTHASRKRPQSIFQSFPNTANPSEVGSDDEDDSRRAENDDEWGAERGAGRREEDGPESAMGERWAAFKRSCGKGAMRMGRIANRIGDFMTVPLWAALLSLFVACTPPLQAALHEVEPLRAALKNAGNCSVPITLVTLGAYFYRPSPRTNTPSFFSRLNILKKYKPESERPVVVEEAAPVEKESPGETRTVLVAVISRMIIVPLILLPMFAWYALKTTNVADDPVFIVVACLLIGSPTAITLAQITSSASGDVFEKLISRTLFLSYAILTGPCTIALVLAALFIAKYDVASP